MTKQAGTISVRVQLDHKGLDSILDGLRDMPKLVRDAANATIKKDGDKIVRQLRKPAPKRRGPVRWKSEKQRRYVLGFVLKKRKDGSIIPYKRTGKMRKAWELNLKTSGNRTTFSFRNRVGYARFVMGTLNLKSLDDAMDYQQPFHQDTGWQLAQPIVKKGLVTLEETFQKELDRLMTPQFGTIGTASKRSRRY